MFNFFNGITLSNFWRRHPALYYSFWALLSVRAELFPYACLLFYPFLLARRYTILLLGILFFSACLLWHHTFFLTPTLPQQGQGHFSAHEMLLEESSFHTNWLLKGTLTFYNEEGALVARGLPAHIRLTSQKKPKPSLGHDYLIKGFLQKSSVSGNYFIQNPHIQPLPSSNSLPQKRYQLKTSLNAWLKQTIPDTDAYDLIAGLTTGTFSRELNQTLSRFGLQHIVAISGFHFSLIALFLSFFLRLFLPRKAAICFLLFLITSYFFLLESKASILRAWISSTLVLSAQLAGHSYRPLNAIGIALIPLILLDPHALHSIGFLFSFLITAALLLFYTPCEKLFSLYFRRRSFSKMVESSPLHQSGQILSAWTRRSLALLAAVHLAALPLCLYFFGKFPLLSLIYNLFFPFLVSLTLFLFLLGAFFYLILPILGGSILLLCSKYTHFILSLLMHLPRSFDLVLRVTPFSKNVLILYFIILFVLAACYSTKKETLYA